MCVWVIYCIYQLCAKYCLICWDTKINMIDATLLSWSLKFQYKLRWVQRHWRSIWSIWYRFEKGGLRSSGGTKKWPSSALKDWASHFFNHLLLESQLIKSHLLLWIVEISLQKTVICIWLYPSSVPWVSQKLWWHGPIFQRLGTQQTFKILSE